jgi:putative transposase
MKPQKQEILEYVGQQRREGRTVSEILSGMELSRASYYRWLERGEEKASYPEIKNTPVRCLTPVEERRIDEVKAAHPEYRHRRIQGELLKEGLYLSASSVYGHLLERGQVEAYERRPSPLKEPRYEVWQRNLMWGSDWTKLLIGGLRWYLISLIDFYSRLLIAFDVVSSVHAGHVTRIYQRGLELQNLTGKDSRKPELRVDRGSPNTSWITREFFETLGAELSYARVRRPTDNAITERFYGTIKQEEIYLVGNYPDRQSAVEEITGYSRRYNVERPHQSLWNFTPARVHALNNKTKLLEELAEIKRQTLENRKKYWKNHKNSDSQNSLILSH